MDPIKINLRTYPYFDKRLSFLMITGAVIFLLLISAYNFHAQKNLNYRLNEYLEKIKNLEQSIAAKEKILESQKMEVGEKEIEFTKKYTHLINLLIIQDIFPWDRILDIFEKKMPENIFLEKLSADNNFSKIILKGYAMSMGDVSIFLKEIESADLIKKIVLQKINVEQDQAVNNINSQKPPIHFEIESTLQYQKLFPPDTHGNLWKIMDNGSESK